MLLDFNHQKYFFLVFSMTTPIIMSTSKNHEVKIKNARLCLGEKTSPHPETIKNGSSRMYLNKSNKVPT
jgi:hypothetical protein